MAEKSSRSVLGDDWFRNASRFRVNPESFLDKRKLTREAFCLDVLKDLYLDQNDFQCKICLLSLLQDILSQFVADVNLLEQIVGSLTNLYRILGEKPDKRLLKSQILVTITTIVLTPKSDCDITSLIRNFKIFLLGIVIPASEDSAIISTACKCLEEIERFFPGILQSDFKSILRSLKAVMSPAFQSYVTLLSFCVKSMNRNSLRSETSTESDSLSLRYSDEENHLMSLVAYFQELLPLMSHMAFYQALKDIIHIVKNSEELRPSIFKLFLPILLMSSEVPLIHLAFDLLEEFGLDLFSLQEKQALFKQLVHLSTHPCLTSDHRLLFSDWLKSSLLKEDAFPIITPHFPLLLPGPFDGPITQEKKSCIIALCIPKDTDERLAVSFLNDSVSGLRKCALLPGGAKAAASFFRTLYVYFFYHKTESMQESLYKLLISIMKTSPHLTPYALSFLKSVKKDFNDSTFTKHILSHLVEHILSIPVKQLTSNLEYYLDILESAAQESGPVCKPRSVLKLLQKLLIDASQPQKNTWCLGNSILSVCRTFLEYHDVQVFYYDLAEVLCLVSLQVEDIDIKDRAKIYYSMLTALSKVKVQSIFKLQPTENNSKNPLTSFGPGGNSNLQFASQIQKLTEPVFQLVRTEKNYVIEIGNITNSQDSVQADAVDLLDAYQNHLKTYQSIVSLPFNLKLVKDADKKFYSLYGIIISTHSTPSCKEISAIEVPVYKNGAKDILVNLNLIPEEPSPLTLHFKAEFTCSNGQSYCCQLPSVTVNFADLILPLPVPQNFQSNDDGWKQNLFELLWKTFQQDITDKGAETMCCQSVFCLPLETKDLQSFVEEKWAPFRMATLPNDIYYIAMHLPPRYHLLMKINIVNKKPFMRIIVDNISMLPWTSLFLQEMCKVFAE